LTTGSDAALLSTRDRLLWLLAFLAVAAVLVAVGFTSEDPDSLRYHQISARMSIEPVSRWIAPEWWGGWKPGTEMTGYFREHPAGLFWLPAALGRAGIPPVQATYIVGVGAALVSVVLMASLIARLTSREDGRAALVLLQIMPVAFIFRIRANHEYPMLLALALTLAGLAALARSWRGAPLVAAGFTLGLLVKGVFVVLPIGAALLWILINPTAERGLRRRGAVAVAAGLLVMAGAALLYDWQYARVTGESFWRGYWARQLAPLEIATPVGGGSTLLQHLAFYAGCLLWHPAPWSLALIHAGWRLNRIRGGWRQLPVPMRRGLVFGLTFVAMAVALLAPSSRSAERYVFSATYAVAAMGVVAAVRVWPRLGDGLRRGDAALPGLPAIVWFVLIMLRLGAGPVLPRI
jgi:4-amino-4-deoxy-L-arabinose transferase-like glycosyltransferase